MFCLGLCVSLALTFIFLNIILLGCFGVVFSLFAVDWALKNNYIAIYWFFFCLGLLFFFLRWLFLVNLSYDVKLARNIWGDKICKSSMHTYWIWFELLVWSSSLFLYTDLLSSWGRSGEKGERRRGQRHTGIVQQQGGSLLPDKHVEPYHHGQAGLALWMGRQTNSGLGRRNAGLL